MEYFLEGRTISY